MFAAPVEFAKEGAAMCLIVRAGIDNRNSAAADDIAIRAFESERAGIVRDDPPETRGDRVGDAIFAVEFA
jgi:hypothetical protein